MGRKKDARISSGKERAAVGAEADMACHDCMGQVDLEKMKETDIREADINALADILEIKIDCDLSSTEKRGNSSGRSKTRTSTGRGSMLSS